MPVRRIKFFDEWRDAIGKVQARTRRESIDAALAFAKIVEGKLVLYSPEGHDPVQGENKFYQQRDSERTGHYTRIREGWSVAVSETRRAGTVFVEHDDYQRLSWLRFGTRPHVIPTGGGGERHAIPGQGRLFFWWGSPKRWPALDDKGPGWRNWNWSQHPGIDPTNLVVVKERGRSIRPEFKGPGLVGNPGDFMMMAMSDAADEFEPKFQRLIPRAVLPLRELFRK